MGVFPLVARVGCLRGGAIRLLEEWSPIRFARRWTEPGLQTLWHFFRLPAARMPRPRYRVADRWPRQTTLERLGISALARLWQRRATPSRCACATATAATAPGDRPAPKSPNSRERWYFCERHAAEYNRRWNYFEGLTAEDAAARESRRAARRRAPIASADHYGWGGPGDGSRSRDEMRALDMLELESDAGFEEIKAAYRRLAKANHPDVKPGDREAAARFQMIQASYDVLRRAEERRASLSS